LRRQRVPGRAHLIPPDPERPGGSATRRRRLLIQGLQLRVETPHLKIQAGDLLVQAGERALRRTVRDARALADDLRSQRVGELGGDTRIAVGYRQLEYPGGAQRGSG